MLICTATKELGATTTFWHGVDRFAWRRVTGEPTGRMYSVETVRLRRNNVCTVQILDSDSPDEVGMDLP